MKCFSQFVVTTLLCIMPGMATAAAQKQVQVGNFSLGLSNDQGTPFFFTLDASQISSQPICFGAETWIVDGVSRTFLADPALGLCTLPLINPPSANKFLVQGCDPNTPTCWNQCLTELGSAAACSAVFLPSCLTGCSNITVQLISITGKAFSFTLVSGKRFKTFGINSSSMSPAPGQLTISPGQVAPLYLYSDPRGK